MGRLSPALLFLLLAWFCAQRPQLIIPEIVQWWQSAASFSHQDWLASELRIAIAQAELEADQAQVIVATDSDEPRQAPPATIPGPSMVRIDLVLPEKLQVREPLAMRAQVMLVRSTGVSQSREVPVPVPRKLVG